VATAYFKRISLLFISINVQINPSKHHVYDIFSTSCCNCAPIISVTHGIFDSKMSSPVNLERLTTGEVAKVHVRDSNSSIVVSQSYLRGRFGLVGDDFIVDLKRKGNDSMMAFAFEGIDQNWKLSSGEHYVVYCSSNRRRVVLDDDKGKGKLLESVVESPLHTSCKTKVSPISSSSTYKRYRSGY